MVGGGVRRRRRARALGDRSPRSRPPRPRLREAFAAPPVGAHDGILVNIVLYGGNDGLNTVVPYTNGEYYDDLRPSQRNLAIPAGQLLPLDGTSGCTPT